eukprot:s4617_g1.t1
MDLQRKSRELSPWSLASSASGQTPAGVATTSWRRRICPHAPRKREVRTDRSPSDSVTSLQSPVDVWPSRPGSESGGSVRSSKSGPIAPEPRRLLAAQMPWLREGTPRVISRQDLDTGFYISPTSSLGSGSCRAGVSAASPFFVDATPIVAASPVSNAFCVPKGKSTGELVQEPRVPLKPLNRLPRGESKSAAA